MVQQFQAENVTEIEFRLLSVASLIKRFRNDISIEDLYNDAERKFDTLIELLSNTYTDNSIISKFGYTLDELKQVSLSIFNHLISDKNSNPYVTLCVLEGSPLEEIRRRRNMLLHIFHPDRSWGQISNESKTRKINEAYENIITLYKKTDIPNIKAQKDIPPSYPYQYHNRRKMRLILLLATLFFLSAVLVFMNKSYLF